MKVRLGLALVATIAIATAGCAAGGSTSPAGSAPSSLGLTGERLEVGIRPRDNEYTRSADLFLTQALSMEDEAQKEARYDQALQSALAGIAADPQNPKSFYQAGQAYVGIHDFLGADSMLTRAEQLHPVYELETEAWREQGWVTAYNMAIEPLNSGDLEASARLFEQAEALYSVRPEALLQLGSLYSRMDRTDDAISAFEEAIKRLEGSRETELADTATAAIWQQHWEFARLSLGQSYIFGKRFDQAATYLGELLAEDPENVEIIGTLASVLSELGQADSTRAEFYADSVQALYDKLLNRPGLGERDLFNAGVGLYQIENYDMAAEAFKKAADLNPFNRDARLNLTQTYYAAEKWEDLIPAARSVLEMDPLNGIVWIFLTRAFSELDRADEAGEVFREYEALGCEIQNLALDPGADGGATVRGELKNTTLAAGTTVTLRFHFGGADGREVGTQEVRIQAPEPEGTQTFVGTFQSSGTVTGYRYEVINR